MTTLVITRIAGLSASIRDIPGDPHPPAELRSCPVLPPAAGTSTVIAGSSLPSENEGNGMADVRRIILDTHTPYASWTTMRDSPGLRFFADLRERGYLLPVVLLTWFDPEVLRLSHLNACLHLFHRYRAGKHEQEQGSFAFRRLPARPASLVETLGRLQPMTEEAWREVKELRETFPSYHLPRSGGAS
ncbi:MAG TPA: hypothetical protein VF092_12365 [Longimicrobium sp.]